MIIPNKWESNLLNKRIATLNLPLINLDYDIIQSLVNINDLKTIYFLEKNSFHYGNQKVELVLNLKKNKKREYRKVKKAKIEDLDSIKNIAKCVFKNGKYYSAPFSKEDGKIIYQDWAKNAVKNNYDDLCCIEKKNHVQGFSSLKINKNNIATIGLIGVIPNHTNQGIGTKLLNQLFNYCQSKNIETLNVSTEAKNIHSLNFYIKNGFKINNIKSWYFWSK